MSEETNIGASIMAEGTKSLNTAQNPCSNSSTFHAQNQTVESPKNTDLPKVEGESHASRQNSVEPVNTAKSSDNSRPGATLKLETAKKPPNEVNHDTPEEADKKRTEQFLSNQSNRSSSFLVGVNTQVVGKTNPQKLSYSGAWQKKHLTLAELAQHHTDGHPWMPTTLDGNQKRWQSNANRAEVLALDFDNGLTIEQFKQHPNADWCGLGIESSSSTPELNKFRAVFVLPHPITDWQTIRLCNQYLAQQFTHADPACKDASRFFFGGLGREAFLLNESARLPATFIEDAIAWHQGQEQIRQAEEKRRRKQWEEWRNQNPLDDQLELAAKAWETIPPYVRGNNTYPQYVAAAAGTIREFGPEGRQIIESWAGGENFSGGLSRWLDSVEKSRPGGKIASIGSLFHLAKENGFRFPKRDEKIADIKTYSLTPEQHQQALENTERHRQEWIEQSRRDRYRGKINRVATILGGTANSSEELAQLVISKLVVDGDRAAKPCDPITVNFSRRELHVLDAPKGNGKTSKAIKAAVTQALAQGRRVHVVVPTRILSQSAGGVLRGDPKKDLVLLEICSHAEKGATWREFSAHVVCPESIHHWATIDVASVVILDECDEVLERSLSAELVKASKKLTTKEQLRNSLKLANTVVISQDMVSNTAVDTVKSLGGFNDDEIHYHLYDMPPEKRGKITINLFSDWIDPLSTDFGHPGRQDGFKAWLNRLESDLKQGKRVYMPMGNLKKMRVLSRILKAKYPHLKISVFDGKYTPNHIKSELAADPTQWILDNKPDIFMHNQVFNSGASFECDYFDVAYEYGSALETAWAQSQRGERNRTSVFSGKLTERNVYVSNQGCLVPDAVEQALDVDLIVKRIEDEVFGKYEAATELGDNLFREIELMPLLSYQARYEQLNKLGAYFKRDLLMNEWQRREWAINEMPGESDSELFQLLRGELARLKTQTASIRARAGRKSNGGIDLDRLKTNSKDGEDERSPLARVRAAKKAQVDILGIGFALINTEQWQLAWVDANDSPTTLRKLQVRALIQLDIQHPGIIDQLAQVSANSLVSCARTINPIQRNIIRSAQLLQTCPAVRDAIAGELPDRWCRFDAIAEQTKAWCLDHARELSALSIVLSRNGTAFAFNETTYRLDCISKVLAMIGIEDASDGTQGHRNTRYRRAKTHEDALAKLETAMEKGTADTLTIQSLDCAAFRHETSAMTYEAILERMKDRIIVVQGIPELVAIEVSKDINTTKPRSHSFVPGDSGGNVALLPVGNRLIQLPAS